MLQLNMIKSYYSKGLAQLFLQGISHKLDKKLVPRILRRLDALEQAEKPEDMRIYLGLIFMLYIGPPKGIRCILMAPGALLLNGEEIMHGTLIFSNIIRR